MTVSTVMANGWQPTVSGTESLSTSNLRASQVSPPLHERQLFIQIPRVDRQLRRGGIQTRRIRKRPHVRSDNDILPVGDDDEW